MADKIVCIGDSITYGYPYGPEYSWVKIGAKGKNSLPAIINKGINGNTSRNVEARFKRDVVSVHPSVVIITVGTNDAWLDNAPGKYLNKIESCHRQAALAGIETVIGIPVPSLDPFIEENLIAYREELKEFIKINSLRYIDFYGKFNLPTEQMPQLFYDEIHPSYSGYRLMGEVFSDFLASFRCG